MQLPKKDPLIKLTPIMKLTGSLTDSFKRRLTLLLLLLFWMPIISISNKELLNIIEKVIFLIEYSIYQLIYFDFN